MESKSVVFNRSTKYEDLRDWFVAAINARELPQTLWNGYCYYNDVAKSAMIMIDTIDVHMELYGGGEIKRSEVAEAEKNNLLSLWVDLQDKDQWDVPRPGKLVFIDKWQELQDNSTKRK